MRISRLFGFSGIGKSEFGFLKFFILTDKFADDGHRSAGNLEVTLPSGDLQCRDEGIGGGGVEVECQNLIHGNYQFTGSEVSGAGGSITTGDSVKLSLDGVTMTVTSGTAGTGGTHGNGSTSGSGGGVTCR